MEKNILEKQNMCLCVCIYRYKIYIHVKLNHFAAQEKLTQHCKSPILKLFLILIDFFFLKHTLLSVKPSSKKCV